jgi:cytochrome c556
MKTIIVLASTLALSAAVAIDAQQVQVLAPDQAYAQRVFSFTTMEARVVKGMPYSAEVVSESVQTLADGNRIVQRSTTRFYRDSEGRTRRDQTISMVGTYAAAGEPTQTTFINDPVAGVNYVLDAKSRTARKTDISKMAIASKKVFVEGGDAKTFDVAVNPAEHAQKVAAEMKEMKVQMAGGGPGMAPRVAVGGGAGGYTIMKADSKNTKKESLGKQTIEGVEAEGTRYTTTIPAGEIGNEQPIETVFESWYSAELQTVIMSKHSDPRSGENTYRLTNINRTEPAHSLFEVPSDYTIQESGPGGPPAEMRYKIESGARRPGSNQ